jgi:hypothetical protein
LSRCCAPIARRRPQQLRLSQNRRGDIGHGPEAFHLEVRRCERINIWRGLEDAERAAGELDLPVHCFRRPGNRGRPTMWYAALALDELLALLKLREGP